MKPEDKVATLEQAEKLVKIGVIIQTTFFWVKRWSMPEWEVVYGTLDRDIYCSWCAAPDVAELSILLPEKIFAYSDYYWIELRKYCGSQETIVVTPQKSKVLMRFARKTAAESMAEMLIWLIENKHIKPEDLKL